MLGQQKETLARTVEAGALRIRDREVRLFHDSLTEKGIGLGAALLAEFAFEGYIEFGLVSEAWPDGRQGEVLQGVFAALSLLTGLTAINCVVLCGAVVVFGPSLAMRGSPLRARSRSSHDVAEDSSSYAHVAHRAAEGMRDERLRAYYIFLVACTLAEITIIPLWTVLVKAPIVLIMLTVGTCVAIVFTARLSLAIRRLFQGETQMAPTVPAFTVLHDHSPVATEHGGLGAPGPSGPSRGAAASSGGRSTGTSQASDAGSKRATTTTAPLKRRGESKMAKNKLM
uniref:Transmembrane protein n=1 Tax=Rhizochromulina marina TaxID=1034831 RepID=A0A7S2SV33_9STRA|mmetsp:Transcript_8180/g.23266  ORF Transcript_8180/g.23266 Transcript_8180/m.23266 type:complete len:284 (+) Transcript_8180:96-947(+)